MAGWKNARLQYRRCGDTIAQAQPQRAARRLLQCTIPRELVIGYHARSTHTQSARFSGSAETCRSISISERTRNTANTFLYLKPNTDQGGHEWEPLTTCSSPRYQAGRWPFWGHRTLSRDKFAYIPQDQTPSSTKAAASWRWPVFFVQQLFSY